MKEFIISEILVVENSTIKPSFKYKSGSAIVKYDGKVLNYIETNNNDITIIENSNLKVYSSSGKFFSIIADEEGRLETIENEITKTYEVDLNNYKIKVDSEGTISDDVSSKDERILVSTKANLEGKKVVVKYIHEAENNTVVFAKHNKVTSLFKAYSQESLMYNQHYTYKVKLHDEEYSTKFISKLDPFYSSVDKIRKDTGDLLDNVENDTIAYLIYSNSKYVKEMLETKEIETIPSYAKQYVRYKTDMDLVNAVYLSLSGKVGSINKQIGIIQIDKTMKVPFIKDMLYYFKDLTKQQEDKLNEAGEVTTASAFVKASGMSFPHTGRNSF